MATIRLKYVNSFYARGKLRHVVRVPGRKAKTLPGAPGSETLYDRFHYRDQKRDALARLATLIDSIVHPRDNVTPMRNRTKRATGPA